MSGTEVQATQARWETTLREHEPELRKALQRHVLSALEVGQHLLAIQTDAAYRLHHETMAAYASDRWRMSARRMERYIAFYRVVNVLQLRGIPQTQLPDNEAVARELTSLIGKPEVMAQVFQRACDVAAQTTGKRPTAAIVRRAVLELLTPDDVETGEPNGPESPEPKRHKYKLPEDCPLDFSDVDDAVAADLAAADEVRAFMRDIVAMRRQLRSKQQSRAFAFVNFQSLDIGLANMWRQLKLEQPYAPCVYCRTGCRACTPKGAKEAMRWLPRGQYHMAPEDLKK